VINSRRVRRAAYVPRINAMRNTYEILAEKSEQGAILEVEAEEGE
jgi:hypothetical protein